MESQARDDLRRIFEAAVASVDPYRLVAETVAIVDGRVEITAPHLSARAGLVPPIGVIGAGKASAKMAAAFEAACSSVEIFGAVIAPVGSKPGAQLRCIEALEGEHPVPGRRSLASTREVVRLIGRDQGVGSWVCLLSGGASSLLAAPIPPLGLPEKQEVTELLLQCGADIAEINVVRKHLSAVKGGRLLRRTHGRPVTTLILSDVVGDDPATVGSGPTVPDWSTFEDARRVLQQRGIYERCPASVRDLLEKGVRGEVPETVRPTEVAAAASAAMVLGSNSDARDAAGRAAARLGYTVHVRDEPLVGDTVSSAREWLHEIESAAGRAQCFIAGGETTVRVRGTGKGGRNQEFALALVEPLAGATLSVLSAGTDGIDGPTDAAGAVVDATTLQRAGDLGMDPANYLAANDSYHFFEALGDLVLTGPTGTNVMDLKIALVGSASEA